MFLSAFVCLLAGLCKTTQVIFTKFGGKVAHGPRKKLLDFGGNPDNVMSMVRVMNPWGTEYRARIPKLIRNNLLGA